MKYSDNRDIRDRDYEGPLIIEDPEGVSEEEALRMMLRILKLDKFTLESKVEQLEKQLKETKRVLEKISKRL